MLDVGDALGAEGWEQNVGADGLLAETSHVRAAAAPIPVCSALPSSSMRAAFYLFIYLFSFPAFWLEIAH